MSKKIKEWVPVVGGLFAIFGAVVATILYVADISHKTSDFSKFVAKYDSDHKVLNKHTSDIKHIAWKMKIELPEALEIVDRKFNSTGDPILVAQPVAITRQITSHGPPAPIGTVLHPMLHISLDEQGRVAIIPPTGKHLKHSSRPDGSLIVEFK